MTRQLCRDVFLFENGLNWGSPASRMSVTGLPRGSDRTVRERRGQSGGRGGLVPKAQRWEPSAWAGRVIFSVTCHLWRHSEKCSLTLNAEQRSLSDTSCVIPAKNCGVIQFLFLVFFGGGGVWFVYVSLEPQWCLHALFEKHQHGSFGSFWPRIVLIIVLIM